MSDRISRRDFVKLTLRAGAGAFAVGSFGYLLHNRSDVGSELSRGEWIRDYTVGGSDLLPEMVIVKGNSPGKLVRAAIDSLGGMGRFVSKGDIVGVKPNMAWDRTPEQAANTNPEIISNVVDMCYSAGAKDVIVTDSPCNEPRRVFQRSGIASAAREAGAKVILPKESLFKTVSIKGEVLRDWPVYIPLIEVDKIINIPILKHHNFAHATMAMKNWYGILGGRRNRLHQQIDLSIADLADFMRPTLVILDAFRALVTNGPQGGSLDDVRLLGIVAAGLDQVAIDAYGATLLGLRPSDLGYIRIGDERGLGTMRYDSLRIKEDTLS